MSNPMIRLGLVLILAAIILSVIHYTVTHTPTNISTPHL